MPRRKTKYILAEQAAAAASKPAPTPVPAAEPWPAYLPINDSPRGAAAYMGHYKDGKPSRWRLYRLAAAGLLRVNRNSKPWSVARTDLDALFMSEAKAQTNDEAKAVQKTAA